MGETMIGCPDDEVVLAFVEGRLEPARAASIVAHLDGCPACRRVFSSLARLLPDEAPADAAGEDRGAPAASDEPAAAPAPVVPGGLAPAAARALIGRRVGNFQVTGFIGAGSMGAVLEGHHVLLGHRVAIKVMQLEQLAPRELHEATARFITEAKALTEIRDLTHVIKLHDFGELDDPPPEMGPRDAGTRLYYYAMEHLFGRTLEAELRARGRLPVSEALALAGQICAGLEAAHAARILHRDLKPANVFLVAETAGGTADEKVDEPAQGSGSVKLLDFGLAKRLAEHQSLTQGGMGTPIYAAPELVRGERARIGPPTDVYSVGVILYRMLTGLLPFDLPPGASARDLLLLPTKMAPMPLRARRDDLPAALGALVDRTLAERPEDRPQTARALADALRGEDSRGLDLGAGRGAPPLPEPATAPTPPSTRRPRPRWQAPVLGGTAVLAAAALFLLKGQLIPAPPVPPPPSVPPPALAPPPHVEVSNLLRATGATVRVSSTVKGRPERPDHLVDGRLETAYCSRSGDLIGAWIAFALPRDAWVEAIELTCGLTRISAQRDLFLMNHRIARVRLWRDGQPLGTFPLDVEMRRLQSIPVRTPGGAFRLEVVDTVPGTRRRHQEACISELRVAGRLPPGQRVGDETPVVAVGVERDAGNEVRVPGDAGRADGERPASDGGTDGGTAADR